MLLADEARAVIGSINLAPGSFDERRELAIETDAPEVIARLKEVTRHDWNNSVALDLSDEGVLADLNKHHQGHAGAKQLALKPATARRSEPPARAAARLRRPSAPTCRCGRRRPPPAGWRA